MSLDKYELKDSFHIIEEIFDVMLCISNYYRELVISSTYCLYLLQTSDMEFEKLDMTPGATVVPSSPYLS